MIDVRVLRAARAMLGWSQAYAAEKAGISRASLARIEAGETDPRVSTIEAVQRVLEEGGVEFLRRDGGKGEGVRLKDGV